MNWPFHASVYNVAHPFPQACQFTLSSPPDVGDLPSLTAKRSLVPEAGNCAHCRVRCHLLSSLAEPREQKQGGTVMILTIFPFQIQYSSKE